MKQTTNYQLNLIESNDTFSPNPLNENMEKVETALTDLDGALTDQIAAVMTAMGSGGSTARIAYGSWVGDGNYGYNHKRTLTFGFKPVLVIAYQYDGRYCQIMIRDSTTPSEYTTTELQWGEKSVTFWNPSDVTGHLSQKNFGYYYVAIGV